MMTEGYESLYAKTFLKGADIKRRIIFHFLLTVVAAK
jgi:hypothetical protein